MRTEEGRSCSRPYRTRFTDSPLAVAFTLQLMPAEAQSSSAEGAWQITAVSYSSGDKPRLAVVKHNAAAAQTLVLTCDKRCNPDEVWRDSRVDGSH